MPDIVSVLKQDHREVDAMLEQLEREEGNLEQIKTKLVEELYAHAEAESDVVYAAVREAVPELDEEVADGEAEHEHVEEALRQLAGMTPGEPGFDGLVAALAGEVRHHVEEEEQDILPRFQQAVDRATLDELGERFLARKQEIIARGAAPASARKGGSGAATSAPLGELTKEELYERAQEAGIEGRSDMTKEELVQALAGEG